MRALAAVVPALLLFLATHCAADLAYVWNQQLPPRIQWMTNEGCVLVVFFTFFSLRCLI
jgi:hypothetical protein